MTIRGLLVLVLTAATPLAAAVLQEDFASDPAARGWRTFGNAALFRWDAAGQQLAVTWDSSQTNSYYYRPLGTVLSKDDSFQMGFTLQLHDMDVGPNPDKPFTFEIAVGLLHIRSATNSSFLRGTGRSSPNLVELDYFPDSGFGATLSPTIVSSSNRFQSSFTFPFELTRGDWFDFELHYSATNQTLTTRVRRNGEAAAAVKDVTLGVNFGDFRVDTLAVSSYSDAGAGGSVLAHGQIDQFTLTYPDPPSVALAGGVTGTGVFEARFIGEPGWTYTLERTTDWTTWEPAAASVEGTGGTQPLIDERGTVSSLTPAFYRLRQDRL